MKKINIAISGCLGRMGQQLIKSSKKDNIFKIVAVTENKIIKRKILGYEPKVNSEETFRNADVIIDFTTPKCTFELLKIASKLKKKLVIGTTGFSPKEEKMIRNYSKKIPILKAGNMSLGVNLLVYITEIVSQKIGNKFLSKVHEVHHKLKKDYPSGTALMLGRGIATGKKKDFYTQIGRKYLNKKNFPYSKKINFNSLRIGKTIGKHKVLFSSGKEMIHLYHEAFDRALFSEGALEAVKWIRNKKAGYYSMRNVLEI